MKVRELIEHLQKCNPDVGVFYSTNLGTEGNLINHVTEIKYSDEQIPNVTLCNEGI